MLVPVYINGRGPYPLILDTGSSGIVITPKVATELALEATPPQEDQGCSGGKCVGVGGAVLGQATRVNDINVASTSKQDMMVAIIDLAQIAPKGKAPEYGIIGYPYLRDLRLVIDYPNRRFALLGA
jgi:predicted aspartyl protease